MPRKALENGLPQRQSDGQARDPVGDFGRIGRGGSGRGVGYGTGPVHPLAPQGGARPSRGTLGAVEVHIPHFPVECGSAVSEPAHQGAADLA